MANAMLFIVSALVFSVSVISGVRLHNIDNTIEQDEKWEEWKGLYEKHYDNRSEETRRKNILIENLEKISEYNKVEHTFSLAMNQLGDLTQNEYENVLLGARYPWIQTRGSTFVPPSNASKLRMTVDWRTRGYVTPVKNQGLCGSCWAFSSTGSLEGQHFKKTGNLISLSEQNLVDCSERYGNEGCDGGWMNNAFSYIHYNGGIDTEASYPYNGEEKRCKFQKDHVGATVDGYINIPKDSESALQSAVDNVGPISVAIDANHFSFQLYKRGVYYEPSCSATHLNHAVLVVGYGSFDGQDYWLVKNSWGTSWGEKGYIMMARNRGNNCGIASAASYPLVDEATNDCGKMEPILQRTFFLTVIFGIIWA